MVLVADSKAEAQDALSTTLQDAGHAVVSAGAAAVRKLNFPKGKVDLVMYDHDGGRLPAVVPHQTGEALTTFVHEGLGLSEEYLLV